MKKILLVMLTLCILLALMTGCGAQTDQDKYIEMGKANNMAAVLEKYNSVTMIASDNYSAYGAYVDSDFDVYWSDAYTHSDGTFYHKCYEILTSDDYFGIEGDAPFTCLDVGGKIDRTYFENLAVDEGIMEAETVLSITEKDGVIVYKVKTLNRDLVNFGYEFDESELDDYDITEYTADAETLLLKSFEGWSYLADGTEVLHYTVKFEYNSARPEQVTEIVNAHRAKTEFCTVTFVMNMDTDNETEKTFEFPKGDLLWVDLGNEFDEMYYDRACTDVIEDCQVIEDITVYLK